MPYVMSSQVFAVTQSLMILTKGNTSRASFWFQIEDRPATEQKIKFSMKDFTEKIFCAVPLVQYMSSNLAKEVFDNTEKYPRILPIFMMNP